MLTSKTPIVSLITVVFNGAKTLRATMDSIVPQLSDEVEYIVIDGGSTDGTQDIIAAYANHLAYWVSEPDNGIYDAMNKAIVRAKGRFLLHINVGDILLHLPIGVLSSIPDNVACVAGKVMKSASGVFEPSVGRKLNYCNTIHHQGCLYSREHIIPYDASYKVYADFDLNQKIVSKKHAIVFLDDVLAVHGEDGASNKPGHFHEVYRIVLSNRGWKWLLICWLYFKWQGIVGRVKKNAA